MQIVDPAKWLVSAATKIICNHSMHELPEHAAAKRLRLFSKLTTEGVLCVRPYLALPCHSGTLCLNLNLIFDTTGTVILLFIIRPVTTRCWPYCGAPSTRAITRRSRP